MGNTTLNFSENLGKNYGKIHAEMGKLWENDGIWRTWENTLVKYMGTIWEHIWEKPSTK